MANGGSRGRLTVLFRSLILLGLSAAGACSSSEGGAPDALVSVGPGAPARKPGMSGSVGGAGQDGAASASAPDDGSPPPSPGPDGPPSGPDTRPASDPPVDARAPDGPGGGPQDAGVDACTGSAIDPKNCGGCGEDCGAKLQHVAAPICAAARCDYTACERGWADLDGMRGNGCETQTPEGIEPASLALWLLPERYVPGLTWADASGRKHDVACTSCPTLDTSRQPPVLQFGPGNSMNVAGAFDRFDGTSLFVVMYPEATGIFPSLLSIGNDSADSVAWYRERVTNALTYEVCRRNRCAYAIQSRIWIENEWSVLSAVQLGDGRITTKRNGVLPEGTSFFVNDYAAGTSMAVAPPIQTPPNVRLGRTLLGLRNSSFMGKLGEVIFYDKGLSAAQAQAIETYLRRKYKI